MGYYDVALICKNGHVINDRFNDRPQFNTNYCQKCGSETINSCQECNTQIRGNYEVSGIAVIGSKKAEAPRYCHSCGKPYPWTEEKLKALQEIINLSDISQEDKDDFGKNLPDIVSDTPRTKVSALKLKMIGSKVSKEIWEVARGIFVDIASETAKKAMGL